MDTSEFRKWLRRLLGYQPTPPSDHAVDDYIREALVEDALAQFPVGTWDRLRKVIVERKFRKYGMWVLDEPWRDPREVPVLPPRSQLKFYGEYDKKEDYSWQQWQAREAVWNNMMPIFPSWVNW
jgi:hypothetical protein